MTTGTLVEEKPYQDFRDWLAKVETLGEVKKISGVDWKYEMAALAWLAWEKLKKQEGPAMLFDDIPGYPKGHRVIIGLLNSMKRFALTVGMPLDIGHMDFVRAWRQHLKTVSPIPPRIVKDAPVLEHVLTENLDITMFPVPQYYERDGGRYMGTGHSVVTKDPDSDWINVGTYRTMIKDHNTLAVFFSPGKHGKLIIDRYFRRGLPCPVAMAFGHDPLLLLATTMEIPADVSEFDYAGGLGKRPLDVIAGPITGLPIPADAEIAIEGEFVPGETAIEGPFGGEWPAYFTGSSLEVPAVRIKSIMYRSDPILPSLVSYFGRGHRTSTYRALLRSALVWEQLEKAGVPGVEGVYCHPLGGSRLLNIVSIKQRFMGHARQAMHIAALCHAGGFSGRYVVVVDEDIDPSNLDDVIWALCTRSEPERSIDIIPRCWSGDLDPAVPKEKRGYNSRALIDACKPFEWIDKFPPEGRPNEDTLKRVKESHADFLKRL